MHFSSRASVLISRTDGHNVES